MRHTIPALVVVAAIAVSGYFYLTYGRDTASVANTALAASTATGAGTATARGDIFIMGVVVPVQHAGLTMETSGKVAEVFVREGDAVIAGQVLARLENDSAQVAVMQAQARLSAAEAELAKLQAGARDEEIVMAQSTVAIAQANLAKINGATPSETAAAREHAVAQAIAEAEAQRAQAQLDLLQNGPLPQEIAVAQAEVDEAQADLQQAQLALSATELRAPFAGTVSAMTLKVGERVGTAEVVLQLADLSAWQLESNELDELSVVRVQVGDPVQIAFDAIPDKVFSGVLTHIELLGLPGDTEIVYAVTVEPDELDPRVRWNMTAQLIITPQD